LAGDSGEHPGQISGWLKVLMMSAIPGAVLMTVGNLACDPRAPSPAGERGKRGQLGDVKSLPAIQKTELEEYVRMNFHQGRTTNWKKPADLPAANRRFTNAA